MWKMDNADTQVVGNADTQQGADWKSSVDEGLRSHPSLEKFKAPGDVFKSYVELEKLVGKEKLPIPTEKDGKELWDVVYSRLGRPAKADEYKLPDVKRPDGYPAFNPEEIKPILQKAHELGLNNNQIAGLYQSFMEGEISKYGQFKEQSETSKLNAETTLRKEWGSSFDEKLGVAKRVLNEYGGAESQAWAEQNGNDPVLIKLLANVGKRLSEDGIGGKAASFSMSPEEANAEIRKIQGEAMLNPKHPYVDRSNPEHEVVMNRMKTLYAMAHPEEVKR